ISGADAALVAGVVAAGDVDGLDSIAPSREEIQMAVMDRLASPAGLVDLDLLERMTQALGSPDELKNVLRHVCRLVVDTLGADHASVFLLDGRYLQPAVAAAHEGGGKGGGTTFRQMEAIEVDPRRWSLFTENQVVVIDDTASSDLIP